MRLSDYEIMPIFNLKGGDNFDSIYLNVLSSWLHHDLNIFCRYTEVFGSWTFSELTQTEGMFLL